VTAGNGNGNGRNGRNGNGGLVRRPPSRIGRRRRERRRRQRTGRRLGLAALVAGALAGAAATATLAFTGFETFRDSCDLNSLKQVEIGENTFVYAADGSFLGTIPAETNRQPVKLGETSPWLPKATVAIEDRRFYDHGGLDYEGIVRAAFENYRARDVVQGGSTITQQLVRNLYQPVGTERTLERKLKEACLALKLDGALSKEQILETYMNQIYYGNRAYGIEAAAQTYFSKPSSELTLGEAALIAGLPQAPSFYDPFTRQVEAIRRRNEVLRAMRDGGYISAGQYERAIASQIQLKPGSLYTEVKEPFFFSFVREQLIEEYGASFVRTGGLRVYTTIDLRFQQLAVKSIRETLDEPTDPASAIVAINPANGAIRAMVSVVPGGGRSQFNIAAQGKRQAGSAFKTFALTEAVRRGINPDSTTYVSAPFTWQPDPLSEPWTPKTYDGSYYGPSSLTVATLRSDNSVYARLTLDLGPESVAKIARDMGVRSTLQPVASIGLGSNDVSVLDMASAYATLAAGGVYAKPMAIRKVVLPSGQEDTATGWGKPQRKRVFPDGVAYQVTRILEQNMLSGTGTDAYFGRPAAGKTGTTDDHTDAWFCGYTPTLSTAVWVGYPNATIEMTNVHGISVTGGSFPATIWNLFVSRALGRTPVADFPLPRQQVVWRPWKGQYQLYGDTSTLETSTTESGPTDTVETEPAPTAPTIPTTPTTPTTPTPTTAPPATEPPPITEEPPVTTAPPPPPPPTVTVAQ
jgi:penicillin-binding protein 1A